MTSLLPSAASVKATTAAALAVSAVYFVVRARLRLVGKDEQLFVETATELQVTNGPRVVVMPLVVKSAEKKKAVTLGKMDYVIIRNRMLGSQRVEHGPQLLFLEPYDEVQGTVKQGLSLLKTEYVRFLDKTTGKIRVERGEQGCVFPGPTEVFFDNGGKMSAVDLKLYEYSRIENVQTGAVRVERGEKLVFLDAFEAFVGGRRKERAIELKVFEYVKFEDQQTGQLRTERGPKLVVPGPFDIVVGSRRTRSILSRFLENPPSFRNSLTLRPLWDDGGFSRKLFVLIVCSSAVVP